MAASLYTLAELSASVYARLENNTIFWTQAEVTNIINEALSASNNICGWFQGTASLISVAGQLVYSTPAPLLYPQRVQFEGIQLDPVPLSRIGLDFRTWASDSTAKLGAIQRWVPLGVSLFAMHPTDSVGGGSISVTGVCQIPPLVLPTDSMAIPDQYVNIVIEYCSHRLPLKVGGSNASEAFKLYQSYLSQMKKLTNLQKYKNPRFFIQSGAPTTEGKLS